VLITKSHQMAPSAKIKMLPSIITLPCFSPELNLLEVVHHGLPSAAVLESDTVVSETKVLLIPPLKIIRHLKTNLLSINSSSTLYSNSYQLLILLNSVDYG
jgi:hypothetical protein